MAASNRFSVEGRVAVITGASGGLGEYFSKLLAEEGAKVVIGARRTDELERVAREIRDAGGEALPVQCDVTKYDQLERLFQQANDTYGRIDIMVNNAGINDGRLLPTEESEPESFKAQIEVDLIGALWACRAVAPYMLAQRSGSIINISSIGGDGGDEWRSVAYHASKGGMNNMTRLLAVEWGDRNVRVNAIAPNFVMTDLIRDMFEKSGLETWVSSRTPMRRMSTQDELAGALLFLASDAASFVSGHILQVDGAYGASRGMSQGEPPWADWFRDEPAPAWGS